jgi:hypothetical protein
LRDKGTGTTMSAPAKPDRSNAAIISRFSLGGTHDSDFNFKTASLSPPA